MEARAEKKSRQSRPPWPAHQADQAFRPSPPNAPQKKAYDLIQSQELDLLYKKNAHLLSRLSTTGKENTRLYTKLSSLNKETLRLGGKNSLLENRFQSLKDQISLFARQHRAFNLQSQRLKQDLQKARALRAVTPESQNQKLRLALKAKDQALFLFQKKEQVYQKQIQNLTDWRKKDKAQKQIDWARLKKEYENIAQKLEAKHQQNKVYGPDRVQKIDQLKALARELKGQIANLKEKDKSRIQDYKTLEGQKDAALQDLQKLKAQTQQREELSKGHLKEIDDLQALARELKGQIANLKEKDKSRIQDYKTLEGQKNAALQDLQKLKAQTQAEQMQIQQKAKRFDQAQRLLTEAESKMRGQEKSNKKLQKELSQAQKKYEGLKEQKQWILKESKKIKTRQKEIQQLEKTQAKLPLLKSRVVSIKKEKERLKTDFDQQIHSLNQENQSLKCQNDSLRKALSAGEVGWKQALFSFQAKYRDLWKQNESLKTRRQEMAQEIANLNKDLLSRQKQSALALEAAQNNFERKQERETALLVEQLKTLTQQNQERQQQIHHLKQQSQKHFSEEKTYLLNEMKKLEQRHAGALLKKEERRKKETAGLAEDYNKRIKSMEASFKNQIQHIREEMENDLSLEQKRFDLLKKSAAKESADKGRQIKALQTENKSLKANEKALQSIKDKWQKDSKQNKALQAQHKNLKRLWHDLQEQNEGKGQQIESLQKLNRSLSQSLNDSRIGKLNNHPPRLQKQNEILISKSHSEKALNKAPCRPEKQPAELILADLHFD